MSEQIDQHENTEKAAIQQHLLHRRSFVTKAGFLGLGAAAAAILPNSSLRAQSSTTAATAKDNRSGDTAQQIFTAALIAEDLATVLYYNGLTGSVIHDPALAGTGGNATHVSSNGNLGNVDYIRAALSEEIAHANLLRSLIGKTSATTDPVQNFYFPAGSFDKLSAFTGLLDALEQAFIGAYLNAVIEFAQMAGDTRSGAATQKDSTGKIYTAGELEYFSQVSASIMAIESEHRVLGRVISNTNPANQLCYAQTDGLTSVYNGAHSAVVALTPFITPGSGKVMHSLKYALANQASVSLPCTGNPPAPPA